MHRNRKAVGLSDRACIECQRRKTRCVLGVAGSPCSYCAKTGKECVVVGPPPRTSLTRKNLQSVEIRCKRLEAILRRVCPDIRLEEEIDSVGETLEPQNDRPGPPGAAPQLPDANLEPLKELVAGDLEWQESSTLDDNDQADDQPQKDGMMSFTSSGYLGITAGSSLLKSLSAYLPPVSPTSTGSPTAKRKPVDSTSRSEHFFLSARLANGFEQERLIEAYFVAYNASYPIVHETTFREQYRRRQRIPQRSPWHIVSYMILAIGEWVSGYSTDDPSPFYEAGRAHLRNEILESGNLITVQALLLLGNYLQKRDRPNTGYNFIGMAYRVALGLGLHRQVLPDQGKQSFTQQRRRAVFWTLYCFDSGFSITTGRPITIADIFIDAEKPKNLVDANCDASTPLPSEVDHPTVYSAIIAQARLAVIANNAYCDILCGRRNPDPQSSLLADESEQKLQRWRDSLPAYFHIPNPPMWFLGPRQIVLWKEANLRILITMASQRKASDVARRLELTTKLQRIAMESIVDIADFCQRHSEAVHTGISWYIAYFLLQSILAIGVSGASLSTARRQSQLSEGEAPAVIPACDLALARAAECLENLSGSQKAAAQTLQILERLRHILQGAQTLPLVSGGVALGARRSRTGTSYSAPHDNAVPRHLANDSMSPNTPSAPSVVNPLPVPDPLMMPQDVSPEGAIAANFVDEDWVATIDPSLHFFLDDVDGIDSWFQGMQGFPSTIEQADFSYTTSSLSTIRSAFPTQAPNRWANAENVYNQNDLSMLGGYG